MMVIIQLITRRRKEDCYAEQRKGATGVKMIGVQVSNVNAINNKVI